MAKLPNPTISFRIPIELLKKLEKESEKKGITKTEILIDSLKKKLR